MNFVKKQTRAAQQTLAGLLAACLLLAAHLGLASESAWRAVQASTDLLLERLVVVQPLYEEDEDRFYAEVQSALEPHIDFAGFSRGVMGKHYRLADAEQRARFQSAFKRTLIRTYAGALAEFDNEKVVVLPPKPPVEGKPQNPNKATILLELHSKSGRVYPIVYQMAKSNDRWLLRNLVVDGVNMGKQFRGQFDSYMAQHKTLDAAISNWAKIDHDQDDE